MRVLAFLGAISVAYSVHASTESASSSCLSSKTLFEVTLPGTHDSGAFNLTAALVPGYMPDALEAIIEFAETRHIALEEAITIWSVAQDRSFYEQLQDGIRYFDVRAAWDNSTQTWRTFHCEYGTEIQHLLDDVQNFMSEASEVIVILEVSHVMGYPTDQDVEDLLDMIENTLGNYLMPTTASLSTPLGDIFKQGWSVLATFEDSSKLQERNLIWNGDVILNTYANSCDADYMEEFNQQQAVLYSNQTDAPSSLYKISWTLTPDESCILEGVLPSNPWGLMPLADTVNGAPLDNYVEWLEELRPGNILIIDHYQTSNIVAICQKLNCGTTLI